MKKHLIAAAVAAAVAVPAAAQVTVYGVIDQGFTSTSTEMRGSALTSSKNETTTSGDGGAFTTQRLGFRGSEDLGGGRKANFVLEFGLGDNDAIADSGTANAAPFNARLAFVGIEGGFGKINLGKMNTQAEAAWGVGDVGGGNNFIGRSYTASVVSNRGVGTETNLITTQFPAVAAPETYTIRQSNSRSERLIEYTTPTFSGITVAVQYGTNEADRRTSTTNVNKSSGEEEGFGLRYSQGALNLMLGYSKETYKSNNVDFYKIVQTVMGANYNLGPATLYLTYAEGEQNSRGAVSASVAGTQTRGVTEPKTTEIGAAIPMGAFTAQISYFDGEVKVSDRGTSLGKLNVDGFQISGLYAFSKRTSGYAAYGTNEFKGTTGSTENTQFGVGIRHSF